MSKLQYASCIGAYIWLLLSSSLSSIINSDAIEQPKCDASKKTNKNNVINRSERIICIRYPHPFISEHFFRERIRLYITHVLYKYYTLNVYGSLGGLLPHTVRRCQMPKNTTQPFKCRDETKTSISKLGGTILLLYYFYYTMCCCRFGKRTLSSNSDPHKLSYDSFPA